MIAATELRLVLVTPEKTLLDQPVKGLRFPLFDGQIGVLPGRAPLVGRLGTGELKFDLANGSDHYFIDGGFVQIKGSVVTLLTNRAIPAASIDVAKTRQALEEAIAIQPKSEFEQTQKTNSIERAKKMLSLKQSLGN
ncbi:F0F1 ATP synthase subunit epsilon [Planctomicrobium sp. SH668]|uniref:F0F1 ATP synthase subunit epsilon n=1 Tax=Planctomicrobium sp. SH668 TaxID=3448126 RepID=UPI003F5C728D